ncbi:MAG: hypothetical protein ACJ778_12845 [Chloroflexota bacterium]
MNDRPGSADGEPEPDPEKPAADTSVPAGAVDPVPDEAAVPDADAAVDGAAVAEPTAVPAVESTRRLLGASFDLLARTSEDMRRASFYIGLIVLGTVGPLAVASFGLEVISIHHTRREMDRLLAGGLGVVEGFLLMLAGVGLFVASVESQAMAASILGGRVSMRPVTTRAALARSRMVFWRVVVGAVVVAIPVGIAQVAVDAFFVAAVGPQTDLSLVTSVLVAAVVGAPLAYVLTGIVLGDAPPFMAARRSFTVFAARKAAASLVAVFQTIAILLVLLGVSAGLDIALRVFDALGLGTDSGPAGLILIVIGIVVGVFALGTLIYTALAISLAPQVVMFVGLTRATFGLDHVRRGGGSDPLIAPLNKARFRWLTRPMLAGFAAGLLGLVGFVASVRT